MSTLPAVWRGLVDDAAIFPPGNLPFHDALSAHGAHRESRYADLVGAFVLKDTDLPLARGTHAELAVVLTGGAGQVVGPLGLCAKLGLRCRALEVPLRDLDDPAGNARRVVAAVATARDDGLLSDDTHVYVELPPQQPSAAWLQAADEVGAADLRLKFRTGGLATDAFPTSGVLASWIDAALDRETPFKATAGLHHAVRHTAQDTGFEHHGFLNVLLATRSAFDGSGLDEVVEVLEERDGARLAAQFGDQGPDVMAGARRWFTSYGSCSISEPIDDLVELGLLDG